MKTSRNPERMHPPIAGYSHQIEVTGSQRWLVLSGQVGRRVDGQVPEEPVEQLAVALENLRHNLEAAAMDVADVVKLTLYLVGEFGTQRRRDVLGAWLGGHEPCMTLLFVSALAAPVYRVEIDAWASRDDTSRG
jgi:enamine deaminase RidA (YjgF/YER057c/UK114 family)